MSILMIGEGERAVIKAALVEAKRTAPTWEEFQALSMRDDGKPVLLKDRPDGVEEFRKKHPPQHVMLGTYRVAFSYERQPAGLFKHFSMSSHDPSKVPGVEAVSMAIEEFGFSKRLCEALLRAPVTIDNEGLPSRIWLEEFEPKRFAINVIELEADQ